MMGHVGDESFVSSFVYVVGFILLSGLVGPNSLLFKFHSLMQILWRIFGYAYSVRGYKASCS